MCSPTAAIAVVGGAAVGLQAYSAYAQQAAANAAARYQGRMADQAAKLKMERAKIATRRGEQKARKVLSGAMAFAGRQRAAFSASGVKVDVGSARTVVEATPALASEEAFTARHNAALEAWGLRSQAWFDTARGRLYRAQTFSPWLAASGAALGGAFQVGGMMAGMG